MARTATTSDAFNAVAEPQRRKILDLLIQGELSVGDIAERLAFNQPQTSKHLKVLKEVGLVHVRGAGKQRLYALSAEGLKPIYDWTKSFERLWQARFDRLGAYLEDIQRKTQVREDSENG